MRHTRIKRTKILAKDREYEIYFLYVVHSHFVNVTRNDITPPLGNLRASTMFV